MSGSRTTLPHLAVAVAALAVATHDLGAQYNSTPAPAAYALQGVTVVAADGRRTSGVTIVVRDGVIQSMAPGATVPPGAMVLEGENLLVYPGLVDAQGTAKFKFAESEIDRATVASWDAPRELQGFTPHRRVVDVLQGTGKDASAQRQGGVVAAAVFPELSLMAGQGTVLVLRPGADIPAEMVTDPDVGVLVSLRGARGVYPGTVFATTAFIRQAFEDARHQGTVLAAYQRDAAGMARPPADPDYAILRRVLAGDERVFFAADSPEDIAFAVRLGEQYGFRPAIVGGAQAWKVAGLLKRHDVPVLVSVNFPGARRWKPDAKGDSAAGVLEAAVQREKEEMEAAYANASRLASAGVRIAITSGGGKANLREGVRRAMDYGLSEGDAIRATTTFPAELLGLSRMMTLKAGAPATFVVADGPLFGKDTKIVYTMVEGELERGASGGAAPRSAAAGGGTAPVAVAGRWTLDLESTQGSLSGAMTLAGTPDAFTGSIDTEMGALPVKGGKVVGGAVTFTVVFPFMQNVEVPFSGTIGGGQLAATASTPMGQVKVSGRRSGPGSQMENN